MAVAGVLALQGDFEAHASMLHRAGAEAREVRTREELDAVDGLVIPGGESTAIGLLAEKHDLVEPLRKRADDGMPILGTCAGMIFCAARVDGRAQPLLGVVDMTVRRNAFGRQVDSFETDLRVKGLDAPLHAVFIRAPWVEEVGSEVEVLAEYDGRPVAVRQGAVLLTAFHPEIAGDDRVHRMFVEAL
ncbi:MAG: pyridoxal 5'-phosphate synthase glutaminase subunit PdxT [Actinomycetota bacterium]|nr:pyridoxal 5'-phosphate synthase glutaminase subunit PdxT [Actinomycetota bacterium]